MSSKLVQKIEAIIAYYGPRLVVTSHPPSDEVDLLDILADVQELERRNETRAVAAYAAGVRAGKHEAYAHAHQVCRTRFYDGNQPRPIDVLQAILDALDAEEVKAHE